MSFGNFTVEEEKEIRHLVNVIKYAKPRHKKKAEEKLFDIINHRVGIEMEKRIERLREEFFK